MMIPEWVLLVVIGGAGWLASYGIIAIVRTNRTINTSLAAILLELSTVNGRLVATETWKTLHDRDALEKFAANDEAHKALWKVLREQTTPGGRTS